MIFRVVRHFRNQMIRIPVRTFGAYRIVINVYHYSKPYTKYFETDPTINGFDEFRIKIPKMPPEVIIEIYNEANGNTEYDSSFQIGDVMLMPIKQMFHINKLMDNNVNSFAVFSDDFAENAGILSAQNSIYVSPDGKFKIDYKDVIRDDEGEELRTPARINTKTGIIEIAKKYYRLYTVPGRKAINWHEFSHLWRNINTEDEFEADKNAILIYLGMGNPTIEAYNVFLKVFANTSSDLNRARYNELNSFIKNFPQTAVNYLNKRTL